jgi:hypothetical protein
MPLHNCIAQLCRPAYSCVLREVPLDRRNRPILDMLRRREMRLAGPKINDIYSLATQFLGFGHDCHGCRRLNPIDAFRKL